VTSWSDAVELEADAIAAAVLSCPAVAALDGGPLSHRVVTLLPGRSVEGVRIDRGRVLVSVVAAFGTPVILLTEQVRTAVAPLTGGLPVDVHVADLQLPEEQQAALPAGPTG